MSHSKPAMMTTMIPMITWMICSPLPVAGSEIQGFLKPLKEIDVAADDTGTVESVKVVAGEHVSSGQELGHLSQSVFRASLDIADEARNAKGKLNSARSDLQLKRDRLQKMKQLLIRQHASQEEVERLAVETEIAQAHLLGVEEELKIRELEYRRIVQQIEQRIFRSPIDGTVVEVFREEGEYVSPTDPVVIRVAQLDELLAVFSVPNAAVHEFAVDQTISVSVGEQTRVVSGVVSFIAPVADAQSGTVEMKVRIPNSDFAIRAGEKCLMTVQAELPQQASVDKPSKEKSAFYQMVGEKN